MTILIIDKQKLCSAFFLIQFSQNKKILYKKLNSFSPFFFFKKRDDFILLLMKYINYYAHLSQKQLT
jgi:hypothetical protein